MTKWKSIACVLLGALFALSLVVFFRAHARRMQTENALRLLRADVGEKNASDAPMRATSPSRAAPSSETAATTHSSTAAAPANLVNNLPRSDASVLVASHPEISQLFESAFRADTRQQYRAFFRRARLTDEQIARFERRMFENRVDQLDLRWSAKAQGLKRDDPAIKALARQQEESLNADLRTLLGAEGYQALQQFKRAEGARRFVNDVATTMALSSLPLDGDQADELTQLIGEASASYQSGGDAMPWDANWDAIMKNAASFLTEPQLAALRDIGEGHVRFAWLLPQFYAQQRPGP